MSTARAALGAIGALGIAIRASWAVAQSSPPPLADAPALDAPPPAISASLEEPARVGVKNGLVYVRDRRDYLRLYPHAELNLDMRATRGANASELTEEQAGADLGTAALVRWASLALGGELFQRIAFQGGVNFTANPAIDGARVDSSTQIALDDTWAAVDAGRGLSLRLGFYQAPISLENRTARSELPMLERNVAIRGLVMPGGKVLGGSVEGALEQRLLRWAVGVFSAERVAVDDLDRSVSGIGRLSSEPLAARGRGAFRHLHIGVSGRIGSRNTRDAAGDAPAITTGQGFALYRPVRAGPDGAEIHQVLDGLQWALGGELRLPLTGFTLRAEGYWLGRSTLEYDAASGSAQEPLRSGRLVGAGWYLEISSWVLELGGQLRPAPLAFGESPHGDHLELADTGPSADRYGFELALLLAGINATYEPAARGGAAEPGSEKARVDILQLGLALNYWHTRHFRVSFGPALYWTPRWRQVANLAQVPGNLGDAGSSDASAAAMAELTTRVALLF